MLEGLPLKPTFIVAIAPILLATILGFHADGTWDIAGSMAPWGLYS